jgi:hypothetical protein
MATDAAKRDTVPDPNYGTAAQRAYWMALGKFISEFSIVETVLNVALWRYAKLDKTIAGGLLGALRVDIAMQNINRVIEARNLKGARINELRIIFDQLGKLNRARNDIVHFGVMEERGSHSIVSNKMLLSH